MKHELLEEIWRVRAELIKLHGGMDGYFAHVQKLDRARRQRRPAQRDKRGRTQKTKTS